MKFLTVCVSGALAMLLLSPAAIAHTFMVEAPKDRSPVTIYWVKSKQQPDGLVVTGKVRLRDGSGTPLSAHLHSSVTLNDRNVVTSRARWRAPLTRRHRSSDFGMLLRFPSNQSWSDLRVWYHDDQHD